MRRNYRQRCESAAPIIPLPVNKAPVLHPNRRCTSHRCRSIVAYDQSALTQDLIHRLNYLPVQSRVIPPRAFGGK